MTLISLQGSGFSAQELAQTRVGARVLFQGAESFLGSLRRSHVKRCLFLILYREFLPLFLPDAGHLIYLFIWISCIKIWHASNCLAPKFPRDGPFSWGWMSLSLLTCLTPPAQNEGKVPDSRVPRISQEALSTWYWRSWGKGMQQSTGQGDKKNLQLFQWLWHWSGYEHLR